MTWTNENTSWAGGPDKAWAGGTPSKGTPKDKRLKENKADDGQGVKVNK